MSHLNSNLLVALFLCALIAAGCSTSTGGSAAEADSQSRTPDQGHADAAGVLALPTFEGAEERSDRLRVVATTSIIGDVVSRIGGERISLVTLMRPGRDPHGFEPAARDLTAVADADLIFVNGWDLEENLVHEVEAIGDGTPLVPVSAAIVPLLRGAESDLHGAEGERAADPTTRYAGVDPHVWFSVHNVEQWAQNIAAVLSDLDPENAPAYVDNAAAYVEELQALDDYIHAQVETIPVGRRVLVTNHDSFAYFADEYGFEVLGTVIPGASTLAEPSARALAALIDTMEEHDLCTLFAESSGSQTLAETVATELGSCDDVQILQLYSGSIGVEGSAADSYITMYRSNVDTIVGGLR